MKALLSACLGTGVLFVIMIIHGGISGTREYSANFGYHWEMADRSSTIKDKLKHIDNFVKALEGSHLQNTYDAVFLTTPEYHFGSNLEALKSLQGRLHEIQDMNPNSFEYQTAIQQITAQEQGEAQKMISVFEGCWWKENRYWLWGWRLGLALLVTVCLLVVSVVGLLDELGLCY